MSDGSGDRPEAPAAPRPPAVVAGPGAVRALSVGALAAGLLAVATLVARQTLGLEALGPLAVYALLLAAVLRVTARFSALRLAIAREPDRASEAIEPPEAPAVDTAPRRFRWRGGGPRPSSSPRERPERVGHQGSALWLSLAGAGALGLSVVWLRAISASAPPGRLTVGLGVVLGALAFVLLVASRWSAATPASRLPEAPALAEWLRGGQWIALLTGAALAARGLGLDAFDPGPWVTRGLLLLCALCALETWLRSVARYYYRAREGALDLAAPIRLVTLMALFHGRSPLDGLTEVVEQRLGLSLRSAWALGLLRKSALPAALCVLLALWGSTSLVAIGPEEQGLRFRFGRLVARSPLDPGLHVKLPWPVEDIARFPVRRVQTLSLGYSGPPKDSLLWARSHAGEEYQLLLGDGRELVSVDATVSFRLRDLPTYVLGFQDPREILDGLAYRLLMQETVRTDLDRLLSVDRADFAHRFAANLQRAVDRERLGLEILHVGFVSLHPPVSVADAYEGVVSAEIERETLAARARVTRENQRPAAQAQAAKEVRDAEAALATRVADARGGVARFRAALTWSTAAPDLFRFRRRLEALEEGLADRTLFVVDHRLATSTGELWIDLRPAPPTP